ncbi:MAG TPA: TetR/AcrR family transcriptional regulator [Streptosporangiaceae bacterium]
MSRLIVAYHHGDLPAALLAAVESAVADGGVSGVSLRDVARRAGVSHSAPAHHFGSKAGLLTAFATAGYQLLAESVIKEAAASDAGDGAAELAAIGRGYVRFAVGHPAHFEVMFRLDALDPGNAEFTAASEAAYGLLTATVERCRAAGRLHGRSPEVVAVSAWSLVHGLSALWISGRLSERIAEQDPRRLAAAVSDLFVEAVLPPPGRDASTDGKHLHDR